MSEFDLSKWESRGRVPVVEDLRPESVCALPASVQRVWSRVDRGLASRDGESWKVSFLKDDLAMRDTLLAAATTEQPTALKERTACGVFLSDDGALADFEKLRPLCEQKGVPFVLAIVRDFVGRKDGAGYMGKAQIEEMAEMGCELVGHSVSHHHLSVLGSAGIRREIEGSILWMRDQGWEAKHFVYPYGAHRAEVETEVARLCECACVVTGGVARPPFTRTRVPRHAMGSFFHRGIRTFEGYKTLVDEAVRERRMLVWMLHPADGAHDAEQQAILVDLIDYMRSAGMAVTTLSEAWRQHGNLWEGVIPGAEKLILDQDGCLWEARSRVPLAGGFPEALVDSRGFNQMVQFARSVRNSLAG